MGIVSSLAPAQTHLTSSIVWYYFNDIYPPTHNDHRPLDPPALWMRLWGQGPVNEIPVPEEVPMEALPDEPRLPPDEHEPLAQPIEPVD